MTDKQNLNKPLVSEILDSQAVWNYCFALHPRQEDFEEGNLGNRIYGWDTYERKIVSLSFIQVGEWGVDADDVRAYADQRLAGSNFPAIVCTATGRIIDGEHRVQAALLAGDTTIEALVASGPPSGYPEFNEEEEE
jgi:hypothetical protein